MSVYFDYISISIFDRQHFFQNFTSRRGFHFLFLKLIVVLYYVYWKNQNVSNENKHAFFLPNLGYGL